VGAYQEFSNAIGIDGDDSDNSEGLSGAVYVYSRTDATWTQQAYVKASNTDSEDSFGRSVSLSSDGNILAVGASYEDSNAIGIDGDQSDNSSGTTGAVYVYSRTGSTWAQQAYVKASNTQAINTGGDAFGGSVSLSSDGNTLAVGAIYEDSSATGIDGDQSLNNYVNSGAVYVY
jgi:hypothetical protein